MKIGRKILKDRPPFEGYGQWYSTGKEEQPSKSGKPPERKVVTNRSDIKVGDIVITNFGSKAKVIELYPPKRWRFVKVQYKSGNTENFYPEEVLGRWSIVKELV